jgi:hypothetical protein
MSILESEVTVGSSVTYPTNCKKFLNPVVFFVFSPLSSEILFSYLPFAVI